MKRISSNNYYERHGYWKPVTSGVKNILEFWINFFVLHLLYSEIYFTIQPLPRRHSIYYTCHRSLNIVEIVFLFKVWRTIQFSTLILPLVVKRLDSRLKRYSTSKHLLKFWTVWLLRLKTANRFCLLVFGFYVSIF